MKKQLMTILKKRYGLSLIITCLFILLFYSYSGYKDVNNWKDTNAYYHSAQFDKDMAGVTEEDNPMYTGLSLNERKELERKNSLNLFYKTTSYDEKGNLITNASDTSYFTMYFNEDPLLLLAVIVAAGFFLFFVDLKTSFNEFLFSLGVSKRRIYFSKFALVSIPILSSVLLAKFLFVGIITTGIPAEYVNITTSELVTVVFASWTTCVMYFFIAAFIGVIAGNLILAPLTVIGFSLSLGFFITACANAWSYFSSATADGFAADSFFVYTVTKDPVSLTPIILAIVLSFTVFVIGSLLFPKLTLEKKGDYLLFDQLKLPVVIAMTIYVPVVLVFSRRYYTYEDSSTPIPSLLIYGVLTALIGSYLVYRKEIHTYINRTRYRSNKRNVQA